MGGRKTTKLGVHPTRMSWQKNNFRGISFVKPISVSNICECKCQICHSATSVYSGCVITMRESISQILFYRNFSQKKNKMYFALMLHFTFQLLLGIVFQKLFSSIIIRRDNYLFFRLLMKIFCFSYTGGRELLF